MTKLSSIRLTALVCQHVAFRPGRPKGEALLGIQQSHTKFRVCPSFAAVAAGHARSQSGILPQRERKWRARHTDARWTAACWKPANDVDMCAATGSALHMDGCTMLVHQTGHQPQAGAA
jgi:hypothetical protein